MDLKNSQDLVTIIVPVYNGEKYIYECIESILNQTYKNIELIIVDDGSTDKTANIIDEISKRDIRIKVIHQQNGGVSSARNNGLSVCTGKYVSFVDADDYLSIEFIAYLKELIDKYNADISLVCQPRRFSEKTKGEVEADNDKDKNIKLWTGEEAAFQMLCYNIAIGPWNKLIKSSLIKQNDICFNEKLSFGEGFNFSIDCFQQAGKVAVGCKKLYNYRVDNENSVMTKYSPKMIKGSLYAQETIKKNLINKTDKLILGCKYSYWHTCCDSINTIIGCRVKKDNKNVYQDLKKVCRHDALVGLKLPISKKEKMKSILYFISPFFAARIINHFRLRKFTIN